MNSEWTIRRGYYENGKLAYEHHYRDGVRVEKQEAAK
jgi:antitoxin component YwqK of YwqJK toxin-antitoxin module